MTAKRITAAVAAGVLVGLAGAAVASTFSASSESDFFAPGRHQFYVWCAGATDYEATATGRNAEDAQMKLYDANKARGRMTCWPVWQGRVPA